MRYVSVLPRMFRRAISAPARRSAAIASAAGELMLQYCGVSRPDVILLLGHMRSGSTLLLHLLLTNPQVAALGERNVAYRSTGDLAQLALAARWAAKAPLRKIRYVADQLNHNHLFPDPALLQHPRLRLIFLVREPSAALASLLELSRTWYEDSWTIQSAVEYYVARLQGLTDLARQISTPDRVAWLRYESLTSKPEEVLGRLGVFLGLSHDLSARYPAQPFTRQRGDPGPKIAAGKVMPGAQFAPVQFTDAQSRELQMSYDMCCVALAPFAL